MLSLIKYTFFTIFTSIIAMCSFVLISSQTHADDLLETSYKQAKYFDYVINPGTTRDSVGKAFLRDSYTIWGKSVKDPIVVRLIKWLLEIVVILWVPLLIFGGIKYITAAGDEWAQKTARTRMINVVIGIVLALSSLAIVTFVSSLLNDTRFG
jgi:Type IV secretion system pilin